MTRSAFQTVGSKAECTIIRIELRHTHLWPTSYSDSSWHEQVVKSRNWRRLSPFLFPVKNSDFGALCDACMLTLPCMMYLCMCLTNEPKAQKPILRAGMYLGSGSILALYAHLRRKKPWRKSWATISTKLLLLPCSSNGVAKIYHGLWLFKSSFDWNLLTVRGWGSLLPVIGKSPVTAQLHLLLESDHNKLSTFGDRLDHRCPALHSQNRLPGCSAVAPLPLTSAP